MDIYNTTELERITNDKNIVLSDVSIFGNDIKSLGNIIEIHGNLSLVSSLIESLSNLKIIKGNFVISTAKSSSLLESLENIEKIQGDCWLRYSSIKNLGNLQQVLGNLNLRDTEIFDLGNLSFVGGNLFLPLEYKENINLEGVTVNGKIRYWKSEKRNKTSITSNIKIDNIPYWEIKYVSNKNDYNSLSIQQRQFYTDFKNSFLKGIYWDLGENENYAILFYYELVQEKINDKLIDTLFNLKNQYPITSTYIEDLIINHYDSINLFEKSWSIIEKRTYISIDTLVYYELKIGKKLLNGDLIFKLTTIGYLTSFGIENIEEIKNKIVNYILVFEKENNLIFFNTFINPENCQITSENYLSTLYLYFIKKKENNFSNLNYYKRFFLTESDFYQYLSWDTPRIDVANKFYELPHLIRKAIINQLNLILRDCENLVRKERDLPLIGEGWISETDLYYKLKVAFSEYSVIHHAHPIWLGRQHLDIYIRELNIGVEYQGKQHFEPIEFFGGNDSFEKTVERDLRKKQLCLENKCFLLYVEENYNFGDLCEEINRIKNAR